MSVIDAVAVPVDSNQTCESLYEGQFNLSLSLARQEALALEAAYYQDSGIRTRQLTDMIGVMRAGVSRDTLQPFADAVLQQVVPVGFVEMYAVAVFVVGYLRRLEHDDYDSNDHGRVAFGAAGLFDGWKREYALQNPAAIAMLARARFGDSFPGAGSRFWRHLAEAWQTLCERHWRVPVVMFNFDSADGVLLAWVIRMGIIHPPMDGSDRASVDAWWNAVKPASVQYALRRYLALMVG